jgi:heme/copper-type cytochrome/quinol oxidase subunit 1
MRLIPMVCVAMLLAATFALELGSQIKGWHLYLPLRGRQKSVQMI